MVIVIKAETLLPPSKAQSSSISTVKKTCTSISQACPHARIVDRQGTPPAFTSKCQPNFNTCSLSGQQPKRRAYKEGKLRFPLHSLRRPYNTRTCRAQPANARLGKKLGLLLHVKLITSVRAEIIEN